MSVGYIGCCLLDLYLLKVGLNHDQVTLIHLCMSNSAIHAVQMHFDVELMRIKAVPA